MKKFVLYILSLIAGVVVTQAQPNIYGLTPGSGIVPSNANALGNLMKISNAKIYGTTKFRGGSVSTVIPFLITTGNYNVLKNFDNTNGGYPYGSLVQASDGLLYGMTAYGGNGNAGVIFSLDPASGSYTVLFNFGGTIGAYPQGSLMQATDGMLYGMTKLGGSSYGVIFSLDPATSSYTVLKNFDSTSGSLPYGNLVQALDGKLYGATAFGGSSNNGVIFSLDPASGIYTMVKDFDNISGSNPYGSLVQGRDGLLYGTTFGGGNLSRGVIFSLDPTTSSYSVVNNFDFTSGGYPEGSLVQASDGLLYGTTPQGGNGDAGVIFSLDPAINSYIVLKNFDNTGGSRPFGTLAQATNGTLYGTTEGGGSNDAGVIFSLDPATSNYVLVKDFVGSSGTYPFGGLLQARDGLLYGMTSYGGSNDAGVIFSFDPATIPLLVSKSNFSIPATATNKITQIADVNKEVILSKLKVTVLANPSHSYFTLNTQSGSDEPLMVVTFDAVGREIEKRRNVAANGTLMLGESYRPGSYFTEVRQGTRRVTLKLIKQRD